MWNVTNLRGTKTLSQFPAVTVSPVTSACAPAAVRKPDGNSSESSAVPPNSAEATAKGGCTPPALTGKLGPVGPELRELATAAGRRINFPSATVTLSGVVPGGVISNPNGALPANLTSPNVPRRDVPFASSINLSLGPEAPSTLPLRFLFEGNPPSLWLGAACALFALSETLCELPEPERLTVSIGESEVNGRGELSLGYHKPPTTNDAAPTEASVVEELVQRLVRATLDDASPTTHGDRAATSPIPDWLRQLHAGEHRPASIPEFAMWLGVQINLPRSQQTEEIRQWVRRRRRMAQTHEGMLMRQLGGALACLSTSPQVTRPTQKQNGWVWLSALVIVLGVGVAAQLLLR